MSSSYRISLDTWLSQLEVTAEVVVDVGGSQLPVKGRTSSWNVQEYFIADLPEPHKDSPKPDIKMDLNEPFGGNHTKGGLFNDQFDLVFCLEVFDYIYDPFNAFQTIYLMLKHGGTAWVTFPSFYPLHQPVEDDALRYMPGGIVKLADAVGLSVEQMIKRRPETNLLDQFYRAERMRAAKHEDHEFTGFIVEFKK